VGKKQKRKKTKKKQGEEWDLNENFAFGYLVS
jgi:hypothetical protein